MGRTKQPSNKVAVVPPKPSAQSEQEEAATRAVAEAPKKRGRPPKTRVHDEEEEEEEDEEDAAETRLLSKIANIVDKRVSKVEKFVESTVKATVELSMESASEIIKNMVPVEVQKEVQKAFSNMNPDAEFDMTSVSSVSSKKKQVPKMPPKPLPVVLQHTAGVKFVVGTAQLLGVCQPPGSSKLLNAELIPMLVLSYRDQFRGLPPQIKTACTGGDGDLNAELLQSMFASACQCFSSRWSSAAPSLWVWKRLQRCLAWRGACGGKSSRRHSSRYFRRMPSFRNRTKRPSMTNQTLLLSW
jgi:hypothetical protein